MTTVIREISPPEDWPYIKAHAQPVMCVDTCGLVVLDDETGEHYGAAVLDHFNANAAHMHLCITHPVRALRAGLLYEIADYAFNFKNRGVVFGYTAACNDEINAFNRHAGWTEVARLRDGFDVGVDQIIYEMRKESCQWLERGHDNGR